MRTICHFCFFILRNPLSIDLIYAGRLVFDKIYKEEILDSS